MHSFKRISGIAVLLLFLGNCASPPPASRMEKLAGAYCECLQTLVALNREMEPLVGSDTSGQTIVYFQQLQEAYDEAKACSATLIGQFGKLKSEEYPEMERLLAGKCPELASQRDLLREMLGE
jgi:hypothetical protein